MAIVLFILVSVAGTLIVALAANAKVVEIGKAMMWVGYFYLLGALAGGITTALVHQ